MKNIMIYQKKHSYKSLLASSCSSTLFGVLFGSLFCGVAYIPSALAENNPLMITVPNIKDKKTAKSFIDLVDEKSEKLCRKSDAGCITKTPVTSYLQVPPPVKIVSANASLPWLQEQGSTASKNVFFERVASRAVKDAQTNAAATKTQAVAGYTIKGNSIAEAAQVNPVLLAELAPAAGGDAVAEKPIEEKPAVGSVPLIALPEAVVPNLPSPDLLKPKQEEQIQPSAEIPPAPPTSAPATEALIASKETVEIVPPAEDAVILPTTKKAAVGSVEQMVTPAVPLLSQPTAALPDVNYVPPENKTENDIEKPAKKSSAGKKSSPKTVKPVDSKLVKKSTQSDKVLADTALADAVDDGAETLSPDSVKLLNAVKPPSQKSKPATNEKIDVSHGHDMQDLFKERGGVAQSPASQILGVKVEKKTQALDADAELDNAYNAVNSGQSEAAIAIYQSILDNSPNNKQALFGLATMYHRARQFDKARPLYARLLAIDPQNRDGFNNFLVLLADEAPKEALGELEKLEDKNPSFATIPAQIAVIYQKLGDKDKAIDKMFRAVALAPENLTYRYNLAIMLDKQKNYDEAAKLYRQLIEASARGEKIPGKISDIQQRLTFISSNR